MAMAPSLLRPEVDPEAARRARDKVLERVAEAGVITPQELAEAKQAGVPGRRLAMPFLAPHLAEQLVAADPLADTIRTTLDARLQEQVEGLALRAARQLGEGVSVAVLVVENGTGRVAARVGSADYFDRTRDGMVDMIGALRSPGSALKPFIYAMAFERLIAHPDTLVADTPHRFGVYAPTNFAQSFQGEVTLREELPRSLNVQAVMLLDKVGPLRFDLRLQEAGVTLVFDRERDGAALPLALGGAGISRQDLVMLYTAFARGGTTAEPYALAEEGAAEPVADEGAPFVSELAAWYVTTILEGAPRPTGYRLAEAAGGGNRIAFKTGTSYGYRDAWAVGYSGSYTIGVWAGRPDGTPCAACVGIVAAAPLLFQVFDLLPREPAPSSFRAPPQGAIEGPTANLPPALRRLGSNGLLVAEVGPQIAFPLDGTSLSLASGGGFAAVPLKVDGGERPYTWLVNGVPLASKAWRGPVLWEPDGPGFAQLKVVDSNGRTASAEVYVEPD